MAPAGLQAPPPAVSSVATAAGNLLGQDISPMTSSDTRPPPLAELGLDPTQDLWVFAYGSLMWDPGFPFVERRAALLNGYHRRFCIYSHHYRGTPERPGLVLGLDNGGSCRGIAYRTAAEEMHGVVAYLWRREMISYAYRPATVTVRLITPDGHPGEAVTAWAFTVDHDHGQYCAERDTATLVRMIRAGQGSKGSNRDYLAATIDHLDELGIRDEPLHALFDQIRDAERRESDAG